MTAPALSEILSLPLKERIETVERIWASISSEPAVAAIPLTPARAYELDARLDEHADDRQTGNGWNMVRRCVRQQFLDRC